MNLRPYLPSSSKTNRHTQLKSTYQKHHPPHHQSKQLPSTQKEKQPPSQDPPTDNPKQRPPSKAGEYRINLLSKEFASKDKLPMVSATHFLLFDQERNVIVGQRDDQQREVASLTKIMTTIVALELVDKYQLDKDLLVRVSKNSASLNGTSAKLPQGSYVKLFDLIYGTMLPSGNDAAYLLAQVFGLLLFYQNIKPQQKQYNDIESIDLSFYQNTVTFVNKYIKQMNRKAKQLKMSKTNFVNPHGLGNVLNVSTARDMLLLARHAASNQLFRTVMSTREHVCEVYDEEGVQAKGTRTWKNTNRLIDAGWEGMKTGHTPSAGCCLASLKDGVFIVVLNSSSIENRFQDTIQLYKWYQVRGLTELAKQNGSSNPKKEEFREGE